MSLQQNTKNLASTLELAKFGADRHNERRQLEFRIFISYITLLALALYHVLKPEDPIFNVVDASFSSLFLRVSVLYLIHFFYCWWQKNVSISLINDVRSRDFYLRKAQCISYYMSKHPNLAFTPSRTKQVSLNRAGGRSDKISESCLFDKRLPNIIKKYSLLEFSKVLYDPHIWFQFAVPKLMLTGLTIAIFKEHLWFQICGSVLIWIFILVLAGVGKICNRRKV